MSLPGHTNRLATCVCTMLVVSVVVAFSGLRSFLLQLALVQVVGNFNFSEHIFHINGGIDCVLDGRCRLKHFGLMTLVADNSAYLFGLSAHHSFDLQSYCLFFPADVRVDILLFIFSNIFLLFLEGIIGWLIFGDLLAELFEM